MSNTPPYVDVSDAVIISDLLYYISNKLHNTPVRTVITTCHNFYTDEDYVFNEKKKLCDATSEVCMARRNDNKRLSNIEDICSILTRRDSQNLSVPKFASLNLNNVPINESGDPSLGQIMAAIVDIRRKMVTKEILTSSLTDLQSALSPSSSSDASPTSSHQPPPPPPAAPINSSASSAHSTSSNTLSPTAPSFNEVVAAEGRSEGGGGGRGGGRRRGGGRGGHRRETSHSRTRLQRASSNASQSRVIIGKKVSEGLLSVKGADLTVNKYIGRLHNDVTTEAMRDFLVAAHVTVVELEQLETKHDRFKSFRLRIKRDDLKIVEEQDFWPEGVLCGPFFRPKTNEERHQPNGGTTASASMING